MADTDVTPVIPPSDRIQEKINSASNRHDCGYLNENQRVGSSNEVKNCCEWAQEYVYFEWLVSSLSQDLSTTVWARDRCAQACFLWEGKYTA